MAIAKSMGKMLGEKAAKMVQISDQMEQVNGKKGEFKEISKEDQASKFTQLNAEFSAASQEFSMLSQSINTALKTLGESLSGLARKQ